MIVKCNKCGDESNSEPNVTCGRVEIDEKNRTISGPCTGVYQHIPVPLSDKSFVITASIFVDGVNSAEQAAAAVAEANEELAETVRDVVGANVTIRLPDPDSGYVWSEIGVDGSAEEETGYTIQSLQFTDQEITLIEVWVQMMDPEPGDYTLGAHSSSPVSIRVDDNRHIVKRDNEIPADVLKQAEIDEHRSV